METEFMTTKEVAEYLSIKPEMVNKMVKTGLLKPMILSHKIRRYRKSDVDAVVKALSERGY